MKKNIFNVLSSKLFVLLIAFSALTLLFYYYTFNKSKVDTSDVEFTHLIFEYKNKEEIIENKKDLILILDELTEDEVGYKEYKKRLEESIIIYDILYENDVPYKEIYDDISNTNYNDQNIFIKNYLTYFFIEVLVACIVILYISFSCEFDIGIYKFIYNRKNRGKLLREKLLCFLIMLVGYIAFLGGLLLILSKMFDDSFSYTFLITKNNVELITMTKYMFIYEFMNVVYISIFFCLIYLLLTLIFNKTLISTSIIILIFALIFALSAISPKIGFYLGMTNDFSNAATVKMEFFLSKLILLLPIVLFIVSIRYFKRKNLNC